MKTKKSIVVLPFQNISSDPENEYFADGITEELINALSRIQGLKVTARTSSFAYKNQSKDVRAIGKELGVATALEGSIRKAGNRVRVSTQLIRTEDGFQVWSDSFDRDLTNIFELQDEISLLIADKIRENFGHLEINEHLITPHTNNIEAYSAYLKGRFYQLQWNFDNFDKAIAAYKLCIDIDPEFYQPYFGLVQCYGYLVTWGAMNQDQGLSQAVYYFNQGLKLKDNSSEAHFAIANKSLWVNWQPSEALMHLKQALAINSNNSEFFESAAECYMALGQFAKATTFINKALEVSPLSANHHFTLGNIYYLQENYPKALECFERSLKIDPTWELALQLSANCYILMGNRQGLDDLMKAHPNLTEGNLFTHLYDAVNLGKLIDLKALPELRDVYFPWSLWTLIYAHKPSQALKQLSLGIERKLSQYINFQNDPLNKPLRHLKEYQLLCKSVFDKPVEQSINKVEKKPNNVLIPQEEQAFYKQRLEQLMLNEQMYTFPNLTLRSLAKDMDLHANKLSWLINVVLGKNFNEYVNGLRVEAFKKKALEPTFNNYSLLGIAYECGFNSKSVFNDFFKKSEGVPPSAWLKNHKA